MKPLRILLGNNTLSLLAGSETWTLTLALQLKAMGHYVVCFSPELGVISDKLQEAGIPCYKEIVKDGVAPFSFVLEEPKDHTYDVIISNHNHIVDYLRSQFPITPIISTVHGILHFGEDRGIKVKAPEHPALDAGVNQFVAVSEEVRDMLMRDYGIDSVIIRNFFDIKRLGALKAPNSSPKQFLINTNYSSGDEPVVMAIRDAAKKMGAKVAAIGQNFNQAIDITRAIEDSDVVFGMGRSVLEGVAAGRLGIVHGRWGTGGPVVESEIDEIRKFNFSGRNAQGVEMTDADEIVRLVEKYYTPAHLEWGKNYVAKNHNVALAAEEYVRLARELTGEAYSRPPKATAVDPAAKPFRLASKE
jgi:hypothetical protein